MTVSSRFRLRVRGKEIALPLAGDFRIGRTGECDLIFDDPHVSRVHAIIHAHPDYLEIEDAGSRNGVLVNGEQIQRIVRLRHADWIMIGAKMLAVVDAPTQYPDEPATRVDEPEVASHKPTEQLETTRGTFYDVLLAGAERALARGDAVEAHGSAANLLLVLRARALRGDGPEADALDRIGRVLLEIATRRADASIAARWLDILGMLRRTPDAVHVRAFAAVRRSLGTPTDSMIDHYLGRLELDEATRHTLWNELRG